MSAYLIVKIIDYITQQMWRLIFVWKTPKVCLESRDQQEIVPSDQDLFFILCFTLNLRNAFNLQLFPSVDD